MAKRHSSINVEFLPPAPDAMHSEAGENKKLVDLFLLLYEWNEKAEKDDAKIQKNLQS